LYRSTISSGWRSSRAMRWLRSSARCSARSGRHALAQPVMPALLGAGDYGRDRPERIVRSNSRACGRRFIITEAVCKTYCRTNRQQQGCRGRGAGARPSRQPCSLNRTGTERGKLIDCLCGVTVLPLPRLSIPRLAIPACRVVGCPAGRLCRTGPAPAPEFSSYVVLGENGAPWRACSSMRPPARRC
jgi:hypothetical protein